MNIDEKTGLRYITHPEYVNVDDVKLYAVKNESLDSAEVYACKMSKEEFCIWYRENKSKENYFFEERNINDLSGISLLILKMIIGYGDEMPFLFCTEAKEFSFEVGV